MANLPYKRVCVECNTNFRSKGGKKKFCTLECKLKYNERKYLYNNCTVCDTKFRVFPHDIKRFCSKKCYTSRSKTHPQEFGLLKRAEKMRESWDENAWKKSIQTRKANGNIIDWNVAEWKQYWRRCNDLTRKMRAKLLDNWDGIDYIDGENICENLSLPHTHADYPTLDHVIPRSEGFKQGLSPYEITTPENLKWTKRRNNSKKYNKKVG